MTQREQLEQLGLKEVPPVWIAVLVVLPLLWIGEIVYLVVSNA